MTRKEIFQRVVSILLSLALVLGVVGRLPQNEVQASSELQGVSWELVTAGGDEWKFTNSELTEYYQGTSSKKVYYRCAVYVDGATTAVQDWFGFGGGTVNKWSNTFKQVPTSSYYIPKGTILYEYDTYYGKDVENGRQLVFTEDFNLVCINGVWEQVHTKDQEVTLKLQTATDEKWEFSHSSLTDEYKGTTSLPIRYCYEVYVDGASEPVTDWFSFIGATVVKYTNTFKTTPTTSYFIPAGTMLYQYDVNSGSKVTDGVKMVLAEDFKVVYQDGEWKQVQAQAVTLELQSTGDEWVFSHSELTEEYQGTSSSPVRYRYEAYVDGSTNPVTDWLSFLGTKASKWSNTFKKVPTTSYVIPAGTVFYQYDPNSGTDIENGQILRLAEEFKVVYQDGEWKQIKPQSVSFELQSAASDSWTLTHSELTEEYQGASGTPVRYRYEAYVDGASISEKGWMSFQGEKATIYNGAFPGTPTTSYYIPKGTILYEYNVDGDVDIEDGKQLKLSEDFRVVNMEDNWIQKVNDNEITLNHVSTDASNNWTFEFDNLQMWKEGTFTLEASVDGVAQTVEIDFPDTTSVSAGNYTHAYIYADKFENGTVPTESILIPAGTVMTSKTDAAVTCTIKEAVYVVLSGSQWGEKQLQGVTFDLNTFTSTEWVLSHSELSDAYQGTTSSVYYQFQAYKDNATTSHLGWLAIKGSNVTIYMNAIGGAPSSSYSIPAKTILYEYSPNASAVVENGKMLELTEAFEIEKFGDGWMNPTWPTHQYPDNDNVFAYSLDAGDYVFTSSGAMKVIAQPAGVTEELKSGSTVNVPGNYSVVRYENYAKFEQIIALYTCGDANLDGAATVDAKDLVAAKKAQAENSEVTNWARWYAADIDANETVDAADMEAIRDVIVEKTTKTDYAIDNKAVALVNKNVMPVLAFGGPNYSEGLLNGSDLNTMTDDVYQLVKDCGFNTISFTAYQNYYEQETREKVIENLKMAEKYNLGLYVNDSTFSEREKLGYTVEQLKESMSTQMGLYSAYKSFVGLHIVDEPHTSEYLPENGVIGRDLDDYDNVIGMVKDYTNIHGFVNIDYLTGFKSFIGTMLDKGMDMISYDYYPIKVQDNGTTWTKTTDFKSFYDSLNTLRTTVTEKPFWATVQAGNPLTTEKTIPDAYLQTAAELQWEVNASLAFGAKGIQYYPVVQGFTYSGLNQEDGSGTSQDNRNGVITINGEKNSRYYDATKKINHYIAGIDEVLMNASSKGVLSNDTNVTSNITLNYTDTVLKSVTGTKYLVGCFDYQGQNAYLIVNNDVSNTQSYKLTLGEKKGYTLYQQSEKASENYCTKTEGTAEDKTISVTIKPGQSSLIVLD